MAGNIDPNRRSLPVADWPQFDRDAWARAQAPADPLDDEVGYANRWRPATIAGIENGYGHWLTWLIQSQEFDAEESPTARADKDRLRVYLADLKTLGLADYTVASRLQSLANALKAMDPAADVRWIGRAGHRLHAAAQPRRDIVGRLQPAETVKQLGLDLMHAADHDRFRTASERAVLYRDGLLVAFLVNRPLRLQNLAAIALEDTLTKRGSAWRLAFKPEDVKNGRAIECDWPEDLVLSLERYLEAHRPVLLAEERGRQPKTTGLWVALGGDAMGRAAIEFQVKRRTGDEFGKPIFPHAFRHLAATTIATVDPERNEAASAVLGHSSPKTNEAHYNRARMVDAGNRYHKALEVQRRVVGRAGAPRISGGDDPGRSPL